MRITAIEPFICDDGLREFGFLKVTTDEGIVGWAETYDWHTSASLKTALEVLGRRLIGEDPRRIELMNERIWYGGRPGVPERQKGLAAMDLALWDIEIVDGELVVPSRPGLGANIVESEVAKHPLRTAS